MGGWACIELELRYATTTTLRNTWSLEKKSGGRRALGGPGRPKRGLGMRWARIK